MLKKALYTLKVLNKQHSCCSTDGGLIYSNKNRIILLGSPNVGKSVIFNALTHSYVTVSNYPGTTVTISTAKMMIADIEYTVVDTPGMYSLLPISEEEKVGQRLLLSSEQDILIHVIDVKNIQQMLPLTFQLIETEKPVILVLNMADEAKELDIAIDTRILEHELGIPVISSVATKRIGLQDITNAIATIKEEQYAQSNITIQYGTIIENTIRAIKIAHTDKERTRAEALLLLQDDTTELDVVKKVQQFFKFPLLYIIAVARQRKAIEITQKAIKHPLHNQIDFKEKLSNAMIAPVTGIPFLILFLYLGLYKFVGEFGAGTLVDVIELKIFEAYLNPYITVIINTVIPWKMLADLFVGEYGILTLGLRYAVAIILPIVSTFFTLFAVIEDSGYLPRLAMLIDKVFKKIGLSGRAVIPLVLGLGCSTMATMVTRTLPTKRERIIATLLLALAVPCSAQLGVLFSLLLPYQNALILWFSMMILVFLSVGFLSAQIMSGTPPVFFMEVPPLRIPKISNVLTKTYARIIWYFREVLPLFIFASIFLWIGHYTGILEYLVQILEVPIQSLGLPSVTAKAYIFGFFRRDYGAAGLYDMQKQGLFTVNQLFIAVLTMSLFPACVAQLLMMMKERGTRSGITIFVVCIALAWIIGFAMNILLHKFSIQL